MSKNPVRDGGGGGMVNIVKSQNCFVYGLFVQLEIVGYEPAGLTMHTPPKNDRGWVHFFRIGV